MIGIIAAFTASKVHLVSVFQQTSVTLDWCFLASMLQQPLPYFHMCLLWLVVNAGGVYIKCSSTYRILFTLTLYFFGLDSFYMFLSYYFSVTLML